MHLDILGDEPEQEMKTISENIEEDNGEAQYLTPQCTPRNSV